MIDKKIGYSMKKILALLLIASLALVSLMAVDTTSDISDRNITINGAVAEEDYEFSIYYKADQGLEKIEGDSYEISTEFDISKSRSATKVFRLKRSPGNLNNDMKLDISLLPSEFVGTVNGKENYRTGVTPTVKLFTNDTLVELESQTKNADGSTSAEIIIPAGKNKNEKLILGFRFKIAGDSLLPAGSYTSNVLLTYTYD
ncbi:MAG: hypothetical protein ACRQFF_01800 [Sphaerochaeta sp.]